MVLLGVATLALLDNQLHDTLDRSLRARAVEVARVAAATPRLLTVPGTLEGRVGSGPALVEVIDPHGRIVARSGALGGRILPAGAPLSTALRTRRPAYGDNTLGDEPVRVYAAPLGDLGGGAAAGGAVAVAGGTGDIADTLRTTRGLVAISAVAAAILAALLSVLLTRRALRPLGRLTAGAEAIARTGDPERRLPAPASQDEVRRLADTLNAMLDTLERARENERRFVADASHELRTPLTALRGNAAYVARHGAEAEVLSELDRDATRLSALLDDLLALAREDAAAARPDAEVDLDALVCGLADGDPRVLVRGKGEPVHGDAEALRRAVGNLLENARKHGPADGRITVDLDGTRVSVTDEGPGLAPADAAQAFHRFWRGPGASGEGSGLGLAIVRAIAERHGGSVEVRAATFTLDLPPLRDISGSAARTSAHSDVEGT
ncbi:MAG TPA: HAMP domain-containing sensor histidine kinase [Solirubrobacteraceae bacterium]|nr:HAMP domain-containing sensor histidine kinase [Solirubrobacteraceae bacterium]